MKISLLNELFIFTLEKFNLNGSQNRWFPRFLLPRGRKLDLYVPSRWPDICWIITRPLGRKKKKKKTKQAIKEQRRLRAIPFNESTPCSREGRHSSSLASLNADNGREIGEITPENHPRFHAHGPTAHLYSLSFRSVRCVALFPPYDRSVKHKWSRRTKNGCWRQWITSFRRTYRFDEILRQSPLASSM